MRECPHIKNLLRKKGLVGVNDVAYVKHSRPKLAMMHFDGEVAARELLQSSLVAVRV